MKKRITAKLDHCTILAQKLATATDIFFSLGFVGEENCREIPDWVKENFVPSIHYVFENAYVEAAQFPPEIDEFYHYLHSEGAVHSTTFLTDNAQQLFDDLTAGGEEIPGIDISNRARTDHGEKKGQAEFHLVPIHRDIIPGTHLAFMEHKTRDLIYQPSRYPNPNTACVFDELVLCMEDEAQAEAMCVELNRLGEAAGGRRCEGGVNKLTVTDPDTFHAEFGYAADPSRSAFSGMVFLVSDMDACLSIVERTGLPWHKRDNGIYVDASKACNLILCFKPL